MSVQPMKLNPQRLFLIDGLGALLSAFLLGLILPSFQTSFGMPLSTLYWLAFFPSLFVLYDLGCYFQRTKYQGKLLLIIASANFGYCILSMVLLGYHYSGLTVLGWGYFVGELIIVISLALVEWKVGYKQKKILSNQND